MPATKLDQADKASELKKYRDLVLATIDYYIENNLIKIKTADFDSHERFELLKTQTEEHFQKRRLAKLKQLFRDLTEMQIETVDLKFNKYLQDKTQYDIDIFQTYFQRIDKVISKGKITSDNQFYDLNTAVAELSQSELPDEQRIAVLNKLLGDYQQRKKRKRRNTPYQSPIIVPQPPARK